jgi:hypothetical protein
MSLVDLLGGQEEPSLVPTIRNMRRQGKNDKAIVAELSSPFNGVCFGPCGGAEIDAAFQFLAKPPTQPKSTGTAGVNKLYLAGGAVLAAWFLFFRKGGS